MEKGLEQVGALPGVGGSFLCDNKGDVIVSSDPAVLATVTKRARAVRFAGQSGEK